MFQSTWPCLGYKHADKVSEQMAQFVLSSSAVINPMRHVYSDDDHVGHGNAQQSAYIVSAEQHPRCSNDHLQSMCAFTSTEHE